MTLHYDMKALPYNDFGAWLRSHFPYKVQKISVDAGFTCPNRDGRIGRGGCTFCDNNTFNPSYCNKNSSIREQLETGKKFFARKYPKMKYLAYFQAYTNTYAPLDTLKRMYEEALGTENVVGIVIGTRPDCIDKDVLDYLGSLSQQVFVSVEYGIESTNDTTLKNINRGHSFDCARRAISETAARGITVGGHVILGLPGEDTQESLRQASIISQTELDILKIHQLQIIRGTRLEREYSEHPFHLYTPEEYIGLLTEYIRRLRPNIVLDRFTSQSPADMLVAPRWGLKNHEFADRLANHMRAVGAYQGQLYAGKD
jgi:radical SAM protein (TIGR01212 family)